MKTTTKARYSWKNLKWVKVQPSELNWKTKRRVKNIIDHNKNTMQNGYDYVIIVKKGILELTYLDMERELLKLIQSIGD